jgi:2,3-bisphosphoglycerate-dependent phosphoglycerate mutase
MSTPSPETGHRQTRYQPPAGATEFVLLRHGASEAYVPGRPFPLVDGHGDPALAPEGHEQARRAARRLATERLDAVYVTNLRRTLQTAQPLVSLRAMQVEVERDLREIYLGEWEGGRLREFAAQNHPLWQRAVAEEEWGVIPGAETSRQLQSRCVEALRRLHLRHPDQRVLCVVHGGVIGALAAFASGSRPRAFEGADNCSLHTIVVLGDHWVLRRFNDTTHLDN